MKKVNNDGGIEWNDDGIDWKRRALEATVRADEAQKCLREAIEMGKLLDFIIPSTWVKAARE